MTKRKKWHKITHKEKVQGVWCFSGRTEDGIRTSAHGFTAKQAQYLLHKEAQKYGDYSYPG